MEPINLKENHKKPRTRCQTLLWVMGHKNMTSNNMQTLSLLRFSSMIPAVKTHCTASVIQHALAFIGGKLETKNASKTTFWQYMRQFAIFHSFLTHLEMFGFSILPACCGKPQGQLYWIGPCSGVRAVNRDTLTMIHLVEVYSHGLGIGGNKLSILLATCPS